MKKKLLSLFLVVCMVISVVCVGSIPASADDQPEQTYVTYAQDTVNDAAILHCFNWSLDNIKDNLADIAAAGYTAVQTSPVQPPKDYSVTYTDMRNQWWKLYQPLGFRIAGEGQSWLGTADNLTDLCTEAEKYGIKVIVDVVLNHLANNGEEGGTYSQLNSNVDTIFKNSALFHNITAWAEGSRYNLTQGQLGMPDLKTQDSIVQNQAIAFLNSCVDCGVDGFRFDTAKHIELPTDASNFSGEFWPRVIGGVENHAQRDIYFYGEILGSAGTDITNYTQYMSVTENTSGDSALAGANSGDASTLANPSYPVVGDASKSVLWAESHDTYMGSTGDTSGISDDIITKTWAIVGSRDKATALFFARPSATMGNASANTNWKSVPVAEINKFKTRFSGKSEYLSSTGNVACIERGSKGIVVAQLATEGTRKITATVHQMADGEYIEHITGNKFTVSNGQLTGTLGSSRVGVIYNDNDYNDNLIGDRTFYFKPTEDWKQAGAKFVMTVSNDTTEQSVVMTSDADGYRYHATVPSGDWTRVRFSRNNPENVNQEWNASINMVPPTSKNCYEINQGAWDGENGTWTLYTDHTHTYGEPEWSGTVDPTAQEPVAIFSCNVEGCGYVHYEDSDNINLTQVEDDEKITYTASVTFNGQTYTHNYVYEKPPYFKSEKFYLNPGSWATLYPSNVYVMYVWNNLGASAWAPLTDSDNDGIYEADLPDGNWENVIFNCMDPDYELDDPSAYWDYRVAQTRDLTEETGKPLYTVGSVYSDYTDYTINNGSWSSLSDPDPTEEASESGTITVTAINSLGWDNMNIYYWGGSTPATTWPGNAMTAQNNGAQYTAEIPSDVTGIIFNYNGNIQTVDIMEGIEDGAVFNIENTTDDIGHYNVTKVVTPSGDDEPTSESASNTYTITAKNTLGWDSMNIHYWGGSTPATTWPGKAMTAQNNGAQYTAEIPSDVTGIIFNYNGYMQTVDIMEGIEDGAVFNIENTTDDIGHYNVTKVVAPTEAPTDAPTDEPTEDPTEDETEAPTEAPAKDYYLFGYINGANYACEEDSANMGTYKFVDGKLTATFTQDAYVGVKEENNANWYMTNGFPGLDATSATLYNTSVTGQNSEKLFVPGNKEVEFTLVDNGNGTLTLSYTVKEEETEATTAEPTEPETPAPTEPETPAPTEPETPAPTEPETPAPTEAPEYYLFGYINGANYACEEDSANMGEYKFVDGKLTATFTQDAYVGVKEENNANWYMTDGWQGEVNSATLYNTSVTGQNSNRLFVPGNKEVEFTLVDNGDDTFTLSYEVKEEPTEATTAEPTEEETTEPPTIEPSGSETVQAVYFKPSSNWLNDNARFGVYVGGYRYYNDQWFELEEIEDGIYYADLTAMNEWISCKFARLDPATTGFDETWNESEEVAFRNNKLYVLNENEWNGAGGEWVDYPIDEPTEPETPAPTEAPEYYLFGYINGADYACADDYENMGEYKFVDGKLTATFNQDSFVAVKEADNANWYMLDNYDQSATSATLYNTNTGAGEKLFVPANTEVEFTLVDNGNGTLTLSYTVKEEETEATTAEPTEPETPAPTEPETPAPTEAPEYYLFGWINGANYGDEDDWQYNGDYKFVDGKLTATFTENSYVAVKEENGVNWYMTNGYPGDEATSAVLYNTNTAGIDFDKLRVPANTEVEFTLTDNGDDTFTLSYTVKEEETEATTAEPTEPETPAPTEPETPAPTEAPAKDYYLFGYINGANYACEEDTENMGEYKFVDGKLTATFTQDAYVGVKEENNANWYMTDGWQGEVNSATLYNTSVTGQNSNRLFVPGNKEVEFTLVDNGDDTFTLSYEVKEEETEATTAEPTEPETPAPTEPETPAPTEAPTDDPNVDALITVGSAQGRAGTTVEVPISITNNPGITCMTLDVNYDRSVLTLTGVEDGGILGSKTHSPDYTNTYPYRLTWANDLAETNIEANGVIAKLTFEIAQGASVGEYPITVTKGLIYDTDMIMKPFNVHNSAVEVVDFIYGDVDSDGEVTDMDRTILARYLAGWSKYQTIDMNAADVDCDGEVTDMDRTILARHLAGWTKYATLPYIS